MTGAEGSPAAGPWIQHTIIRYYIDGEEEPSIEFTPPLAAGVGFDDNFVCECMLMHCLSAFVVALGCLDD